MDETPKDQLVEAFNALIRVRKAVGRQTLRLRILAATDLLLDLVDELAVTTRFDAAENELRSAVILIPPD